MAEPVTMYEFVGASPGFDVLYYREGDRFDAEPVVAWAIAEKEGFAKAHPITSDVGWALDAERAVMAPDGSIRCGDLEHWSNITEWLDTMRNRAAGDDDRRRAVQRGLASVNGGPGAPVLALDTFRHKFQQGNQGDGL